MVGNAIRDVRLIRQPCRVCGTTKQIEAHHPDYSKPLDVEWYCRLHHRTVAHGDIYTVAKQRAQATDVALSDEQ